PPLCLPPSLPFLLPLLRPPPRSTRFPYTTLFRSRALRTLTRGLLVEDEQDVDIRAREGEAVCDRPTDDHRHNLGVDRTRLRPPRSEEHTSELQSRRDLVCRLLLEKKKYRTNRKER